MNHKTCITLIEYLLNSLGVCKNVLTNSLNKCSDCREIEMAFNTSIILCSIEEFNIFEHKVTNTLFCVIYSKLTMTLKVLHFLLICSIIPNLIFITVNSPTLNILEQCWSHILNYGKCQ